MIQFVNSQEVEVFKLHETQKPIWNTVRTNHTLDMYIKVKGREIRNKCPFDDTIDIVSEQCLKCPHNIRKKSCSVLPAYTRECGRFDARHIHHTGDCWDNVHAAVVADFTTLKNMEKFLEQIAKENDGTN